MAWRITWSNAAIEDLDEIARYISRDSHYYAAAFVREVRDASLSLKHHAKRGHIVREYNSANIRELFIGRYRLIYHVSAKVVTILTIIHGAKNFRSEH